MWFKCRNRMEKCRARELSEGRGGGVTDKWLGAISTSGRQSENANSETLHTKIDWMLDICFV